MTTTTAPAQSARCHRCHRLLTDAKAVARGYGRTCWAKVQEAAKAAAQSESPAQVAKAVELIEDEAIVAIRRGVYRTVSTDGTEIYLTSAQACTCPARKGCYHSLSVRLLDARPVKPARVFALPGVPVVAPVVTFPTDPADELERLFAADKAAYLARRAAA